MSTSFRASLRIFSYFSLQLLSSVHVPHQRGGSSACLSALSLSATLPIAKTTLPFIENLSPTKKHPKICCYRRMLRVIRLHETLNLGQKCEVDIASTDPNPPASHAKKMCFRSQVRYTFQILRYDSQHSPEGNWISRMNT